jgi:hypothetical protein
MNEELATDFEHLKIDIAKMIAEFEMFHDNCIVGAYLEIEDQGILWQYNGERFTDNQKLEVSVVK